MIQAMIIEGSYASPNAADITYVAETQASVPSGESVGRLSAEQVEEVKGLLRLLPACASGQPWHFVLAESDEARETIARSADQLSPTSRASIRRASHVVVFCRPLDSDQEAPWNDVGDLSNDPALEIGENDCGCPGNSPEKRVYHNLGAFLLGVLTLGIDATLVEGIETSLLDKAFDLQQRGHSSLVVVALTPRPPQHDFGTISKRSGVLDRERWSSN